MEGGLSGPSRREVAELGSEFGSGERKKKVVALRRARAVSDSSAENNVWGGAIGV